MTVIVRPATPSDAAAIWSIIGPVIRAGETYALDRDMSEAAALAYWMGEDRETFVAEGENGEVLGTYYLKPNQAGGGRHIANCGYMTSAAATGPGIARQCARTRSKPRRSAGSGGCSSTSSSAPTRAPWRCGNRSGSRWWGGGRGRSSIPAR